jgi:hypothetical protein
MGTLGGIGELAKEVMGGDIAAKPQPKKGQQTTATKGAPPGVPGVPRIEG